MADSNLLLVLTVFVGLCTVAQLGQFIALFGLYKKVKEVMVLAQPLIHKAERTIDSAKSTIDSAKLTVDDGRKHLNEISVRAHGLMDSAKDQVDKVDAFVSDVSDRARVQMDRVELVMGDTVDKVQNIVNHTHDGVLKPVKEINALVNGVKTGFGFLFKPNRPSPAKATQDEEMFI